MARLNKISGQAALISSGTNGDDSINGTSGVDSLSGGRGDDQIYGRNGDDRVEGQDGFDALYGGGGNDTVLGGRGDDQVFGGTGDDVLFGDQGMASPRGDYGTDRLSGGLGADTLVQGEGNDVFTGGGGADTFAFRFSDPMIALAAGTGRAFTTITDFDADEDTLTFDVADVGADMGGNFANGGLPVAGGPAASFFSGDAADSNGEAVVILTDQGFASGVDAVVAAQNEQAGDLILYFNTTVGVASLLVVDGPDAAHSIARFSDINSITELRNEGFSADDFLFA